MNKYMVVDVDDYVNIIEATFFSMENGCLIFYRKTPDKKYNKVSIYNAGYWKRVGEFEQNTFSNT